MSAHQLKRLGFDLAYLSLLTKAGLKPLSRWEGAGNPGGTCERGRRDGGRWVGGGPVGYSPATEDILRGLGLKTRIVERSVLSGKRIHELIFSKADECLNLYASRFDGTPIDRGCAGMRIEGLLFGYPSCCVENFVAKGYARNSLKRSDQRILFHWACPNCIITPLLLPYYRKIYRDCRKIMRGGVLSALSSVGEAVIAEHLKRAVATAASLVALGALPSSEAKYAGDPHLIPLDVLEDVDQDFLAGDEEVILHMDPAVADEDGNLVPDGVDLALALSSAIDSLPTEPSSTKPYVVHGYVFGVEACDACGEMVNMGVMEIVNPLENLSITVPYAAKHYMEHGSFSYAAQIHTGRVNVPVLATVVDSEGLAHFIPEPQGTDADNDGLRDWEEPVFETKPDDPDSDGDLLLDGIDVVRELRAQLETLPRVATPENGPKDRPFVVEHPMDGIDICPRCGEQVVMDLWDVINPVTGASISIPSMALHFMLHGGFSWEGGYYAPQGRVDPRQLKAVLTGEGDWHLLHVSADSDGDLLSDGEERELGTDPKIPDQDGNKVVDGIDLAKVTASGISALPTEPSGKEVYRLDFQLKGLERCDICGANVNMGHLTVVNPMAQLYVKVPYISLHYMEHGSFSFAGNVHGEGRLDVKLLVDALRSSGPGHTLTVPADSDNDGLKDLEEEYFRTDKMVADSDVDGVPDGFALAHEMSEAVNALPRAPWNGTYAIEHMFRGIEGCEVCGATVNMGWIEVVNPKENTVEIPYIALHYMWHGSFSYQGDVHGRGRVNPCLLDLALRGDGTSHRVRLSADRDGDGLLDDEEPHFGTNPDAADSNGDGVLDGVELAREMRRQIEALPTGENPAKTYVLHYEADCYAPCPVCTEDVNCGFVEVVNPLTDLSMRIPYVGLHFMEMGSFATSPNERVDPLLLEAILRPGVVIATGENQTTLRWKGATGTSYQVFTAPDLSGPWTAGPVFQGDGTEIVFSDGQSSADGRKFYKILAW